MVLCCQRLNHTVQECTDIHGDILLSKSNRLKMKAKFTVNRTLVQKTAHIFVQIYVVVVIMARFCNLCRFCSPGSL